MISIITACYNSAQTILDCANSVKNQGIEDLEHLIIDGGSTDNTMAVLRESGYLDRPGVRWVSEKDNGIYDALNKGIAQATQPIIGILHSDDVFEDEIVLSEVLETFESSGCDGLYGDLLYVTADGKKVIRYWGSKPYRMVLLKQGWMPPHPTLFLKKDVFKVHGVYDTKYRIAADYEFILRLFSDVQLKWCYLERVVTRMRIGGVSNRGWRNIRDKSREDLRAIRRHNIGGIWVLMLKNLSKLGQFVRRA